MVQISLHLKRVSITKTATICGYVSPKHTVHHLLTLVLCLIFELKNFIAGHTCTGEGALGSDVSSTHLCYTMIWAGDAGTPDKPGLTARLTALLKCTQSMNLLWRSAAVGNSTEMQDQRKGVPFLFTQPSSFQFRQHAF